MDASKVAFGTAGVGVAAGAQGAILPATSGLIGTGGSFGLTQALTTTTSLSSGISSGLGAFGSITAGRQASNQFNLQAGSQETQADIIRLNAIERGNQLRRQLLVDLGSANASAAARGLDTGSGTPRQIVEQSIGAVQTDVAKLEAGAEIGATGSQTSASRSRANAAAAEYSGYVNAAKGLLGGFLK